METNSQIWVCGHCNGGKPKVVSKVVPIHCTIFSFSFFYLFTLVFIVMQKEYWTLV